MSERYRQEGNLTLVASLALWEQGLPAIEAMRSFRNRGACFASKLCSHSTAQHSTAQHSSAWLGLIVTPVPTAPQHVG